MELDNGDLLLNLMNYQIGHQAQPAGIHQADACSGRDEQESIRRKSMRLFGPVHRNQ